MQVNKTFLVFLKSTIALALLLGSVLTTTPVYAASTITVTTNADNTTTDSLCSLREAITNSNNNALTYADCSVAGSGGDTIVFTNGITAITLGSSLPSIADPSGTTINGGGGVTISGNNLYRVFWVDGGATLALNNITITNGMCTSCSGGGIYSSGGNVTINNGTFTNNEQAISIYNGTLIITNSSFSGNTSTYGGAVSSGGSSSVLTITGSTFSGNITPGGGGGGNAVYAAGTTTITGSTFNNNLGGGNGSGTVFIDGTANATITNSTFSGNNGARGGGVYNNSSTLTIANSTFSGNSSPDYGGAVYNSSGTLTISNSTFSGNTAGTSGGDIYQGGLPAVLNLYNNILANTAGGGSCVIGNGTISGNNNLVEDAVDSCTLTNGVSGNITGSDPKLGVLTGSPAYFPLLSGSPAADAGDDAVCAAAPVNNTSQSGIPRPQGAHCDMGSTERSATLNLRSIGAYDGWVLEFSENSKSGGSLNATATTFSLGDDNADRQYIAILHFNTASLPDTAVITRMTLMLRKQGLVGMDPFTTLGKILVDIRTGAFNNNNALETIDFQAPAHKNSAAVIGNTPINNWYLAKFPTSAYSFLNKTGVTQFRLRFQKDDNDNAIADFLKFFSGNYGTASARPMLTIEYYVP
jgi:CSLREA domain-containing protein